MYRFFLIYVILRLNIPVFSIFPNSLLGKTFLLNGPINTEYSMLHGAGHIMSIHFSNRNNTIISEKIIPNYYDPTGKVVVVYDYHSSLLSKMLSLVKGLLGYKMNTCNTAFAEINNKLFAVEETSNPYELRINNTGHLEMVGFNNNKIMAAHQPYNDEFFTYLPHKVIPLSIMGKSIPWHPKVNRPAMIHDSKKLCDLYIFPISSLGIGDPFNWLKSDNKFPLESIGTLKWLIYNSTSENCFEIDSGLNSSNIFHIAHSFIENGIITLLAPIASVDAILEWIEKGSGSLFKDQNKLYEFKINIENKSLEYIILKEQIEFPITDYLEENIIGLKDSNTIIRINRLTKKSEKYVFENSNIYDICKLDDNEHYIFYMSHNNKTANVVISNYNFEICYKIPVPYRKHVFHSHLFENVSNFYF